MNPHHVYDYIFTGAGCAGLSLLMRLAQPHFAGKKILVLEAGEKKENDRTWCFWEQSAGFFEPIVYRRWEQLYFHAPNFSKKLAIEPYSYKLIRGIDFYAFCLQKIKGQPNIHWVQEKVDLVESAADRAWVVAGGKRYEAAFVFNSIPPPRPQLQPHQYWLLQHFKGWVVETETDCFDAEKATLMDFRVGQEQGTTFVYVLPFSKRKALVEYTLFSKTELPQQRYDAALKDYLQNFLGLTHYKVVEEEFGIIPMTNYPFPDRQQRVVNIGTAGGNTKGSSGYTFRFIQKRADAIAESLLQHGHPFDYRADAARFHFYDSVLLHILGKEQLQGADIFAQLFEKNEAAKVLRFLDNETTLPDELKLLPTLPILPFTKAAIAYLSIKLFAKRNTGSSQPAKQPLAKSFAKAKV